MIHNRVLFVCSVYLKVRFLVVPTKTLVLVKSSIRGLYPLIVVVLCRSACSLKKAEQAEVVVLAPSPATRAYIAASASKFVGKKMSLSNTKSHTQREREREGQHDSVEGPADVRKKTLHSLGSRGHEVGGGVLGYGRDRVGDEGSVPSRHPDVGEVVEVHHQ